VLVVVPLLVGLLVLAAPIRGVHFGETDERVLPAAEPARQAIETLKADFPALSSAGIQVVLRGTRGDAPEKDATEDFAARLERVRGIAEVTPAGSGDEVVVFTATPAATDPFSDAARDSVADIRALRPPADTELLVGGATARNVDSLEATADRLPLMIGLLVGATLVLMFLAFGSILLPIKAVVVSALSLTATFGILVWIFQDGHGAGLLQVTPAPLEVGIVVLMAAVVFGLSTDYEVFLLSRMVEARTRGATTAEAVTTGLARTGRVISAAALLLIVVTGAFALSSVTTMRFVGVGMIIALVLDATVVRMLLVPAVLRLMGDAAWWAPGPMRRLQERAGLAEYAGEELFPTVSVGRHAAPDDAVARSSAAPPRHASRAEPALAGAGPVSPAGPGSASPSGSVSPSGPVTPSVSPAGPPASVPPASVSPAAPSAAPVGAARAVSGTAAVPSVPVTPGAEDDHQSPTLRIPTGEQAAVDDRSAIRVGTGEKPASRITEQPSVHFLTGEPGPEVASGLETPATPPAGPSPAGSASARPVRVPTGEQPSVGVATVPREGPTAPPRPAPEEPAAVAAPAQATPGPTSTSPPPPAPAPARPATTGSATSGPATTESASTGLGTAGADALGGGPPAAPDVPAPDPQSPDLRPTTDLTGRGPDPDPRHDPGDSPDPETTAVLEARPTVDLSSRRTPGNPDQA
jgi:RND superfamily putative drug exporter